MCVVIVAICVAVVVAVVAVAAHHVCSAGSFFATLFSVCTVFFFFCPLAQRTTNVDNKIEVDNNAVRFLLRLPLMM